MTMGMLVVGRHPTTRPAMATMVTHSEAVSRSATERPTSTAERHIGSMRKRSIAPVVRSVLNPTAVPIADVVKFININPAIAKLA